MTCASYQHIAIVTSAGKGHMLPMVSVAEILTESSDLVRVSLLVPSSPGIEIPSGSDNPRIQIVGFPLPVDECPTPLHAMEVMAQKEQDVIESCMATALNSVWGPPCYYLFDMFTTWVMDLSARVGRSSALLLTSPIYFLYSVLMASGTPRHIDVPDLGRLRKVDLVDISGEVAEFFEAHFRRIRHCRAIVANDSELFYGNEWSRDSLLRQVLEAVLTDGTERCSIYLTGLWAVKDVRLHESRQFSDAILEWLDTQADDSVLFVALGSWCPVPEVDVVELARGLQMTQLPFLWAYRGISDMPVMIPHAPKGYVIPKPREPIDADGLPSGFRDEVAQRAKISAWVNQPAVLRHPAIKAFLTHCGWNSLTEALALCGKPIIGLPLMAEQNMNGMMVEKLGLGQRLWLPDHPRHLTRDSVRQLIFKILASPEVAIKANRLYQLVNEAWKPQGGSSSQMQTFLQREIFRHSS